MCSCLTIYSQDILVREIISDENGEVKIVNFSEGVPNSLLRTPVDLIRKYFKISNNNTFKIKSKNTDLNGYTHTRYVQFYKGIKVDQAEVIVHENNNQIRMINGNVQHIRDLNIISPITSQEALIKALKEIKAKKYAWENQDMLKQKDYDSTLFPIPELVIRYSKNDDNYLLTYKIRIATLDPFSLKMIFLDAFTGNVYEILDLQEGSNAVGVAVTRYSNTVYLNTDSYSGGYRLFDGTRGNGIYTKNYQKTTSSWVEFSDNNNTWNEHHNSNMDDAALDAHYAAQKTYDYFINTFDRNSFNNLGSQVEICAHYSQNLCQSTWFGSPYYLMVLGDGNGVLTSPVTSCDAVAHEFGHGVTNSFYEGKES